MACSACRRNKRRCDGDGLSACARCRMRGIPCDVTAPPEPRRDRTRERERERERRRRMEGGEGASPASSASSGASQVSLSRPPASYPFAPRPAAPPAAASREPLPLAGLPPGARIVCCDLGAGPVWVVLAPGTATVAHADPGAREERWAEEEADEEEEEFEEREGEGDEQPGLARDADPYVGWALADAEEWDAAAEWG